MKKLSIDWNESYEVDPAYPQSDIAIFIDKTLGKIWIKGIKFNGTEKRIKYLTQIINLYQKDKIFSVEKLEEINDFKVEAESFQRNFERINEKLKKLNKVPLFIAAPKKYHYYLNTDNYYQDYAII